MRFRIAFARIGNAEPVYAVSLEDDVGVAPMLCRNVRRVWEAALKHNGFSLELTRRACRAAREAGHIVIDAPKEKP